MYIKDKRKEPIIQADGIEPRGVVVAPVTVSINFNIGVNANVNRNANVMVNANAAWTYYKDTLIDVDLHRLSIGC